MFFLIKAFVKLSNVLNESLIEAIRIWNLEDKLIKMTLIGGSHFYGLLAYRSTERKMYSNLNESLMKAIHI